MKNKFYNKYYIVPQVVLDMLQNNFKHSHFKNVEQNKINKGKVEVLELLKSHVMCVEGKDVEEMYYDVSFGIGETLKNDFFTTPHEIYVTIDGNSEKCRELFAFCKQNEYSGSLDRLIEEAVFLVNIKDKTVKSLADTKNPVYSIEQFKVIHDFFH